MEDFIELRLRIRKLRMGIICGYRYLNQNGIQETELG